MCSCRAQKGFANSLGSSSVEKPCQSSVVDPKLVLFWGKNVRIYVQAFEEQNHKPHGHYHREYTCKPQ